MEMYRPPACYFTQVEDGKQEIYLEWPKITCRLVYQSLKGVKFLEFTPFCTEQDEWKRMNVQSNHHSTVEKP